VDLRVDFPELVDQPVLWEIAVPERQRDVPQHGDILIVDQVLNGSGRNFRRETGELKFWRFDSKEQNVARRQKRRNRLVRMCADKIAIFDRRCKRSLFDADVTD
jgi:hypothetical protein